MSLICLHRLLNYEVKRCSLILVSTPKISIVPTASITSKEWRDPNIKKPAPWPYKTKRFTILHALLMAPLRGTVKRFDENTKIIVVDGNIGAGKTAFAKQLAEAFDMLYIPEANVDHYYTTAYGYDLRQLDPIAPPSYKSCELSTFYKNPYDRNVAMYQFRMFATRYEAYIDGLAHLLNTGQGLVMDRSVYTDFVFLEAMYKAGYVSKPVKDLYYDILDVTLDELLRPHLVIYLDISPEVALERIKKRNDPIEVNSPVLTKDYLETIEYNYKQKFLKQIEKHSEILIYDWSNYGDVEVVVEDIERIDFDRFSKYDTKCKDWRKEDDWEWSMFRRLYTSKKHHLLGYSGIFRPKVAEVYHPADEAAEWKELLYKVPGEKYREGFNPDAGENVWFKTRHKGYWYNSMDRE